MEPKKRTCNNQHPCECPHTSCENHGKCCDCVASHKSGGDLPMCLRGLEK